MEEGGLAGEAVRGEGALIGDLVCETSPAFFWGLFDCVSAFSNKPARLINIGHTYLYFLFCYPCIQAFTVILKWLLDDSRSFNGEPPHLTLNHGFPVIWLSRLKKIA